MADHQQHIAVIGAGWAGCSAAVSLVRDGHRVSLFEAAPQTGGRARSVTVQQQTLDNGQHILLGAYRDTLQLIRSLGGDTAQLFLRLPLQMVYPPACDGMSLIAPKLPAPLHMAIGLLKASGLTLADKLALARFSSAAKWMGWRLHTDVSVNDLLVQFEQTERLVRLMWHPLCIAALNTPPECASANTFLAVLRDSLGAGRAASDMLIPRAPLGAILPALAIRYLQQQQMTVQTGMPVRSLHRHGDSWTLSNAEATLPGQFDQVVIATDIRNCQRLLASVSNADTTSTLPDYQFEAITTVYLQYPATVRLDRAFYALPDQAASQHYGQFVFDRGWLDTQQAGLMAVVISAPSTLPEAETLAALVAQQLATQTGIQVLAQPLWHQVITEKRATWACTPGIRRPSQATGISGLWIAGDYTDAAYPATLESAVRSGKQLASLIRDSAKQAR